MKTCIKCKGRYDPEMDFIEDSDDAQIVLHFTEYTERENLCRDCSYRLFYAIDTAVNNFFEKCESNEN